MIAAGVVEGAINFRNLDLRNVVPARGNDGFDEALTSCVPSADGAKDSACGRAAFFLKGKVKGDYLLTIAYDSDKNLKDQLFRDIKPDEFYPVYGDSSIKGFDAQSTSKLYVRVDKNKSFLLYGDFNTQGAQTRAAAVAVRALVHRREVALRDARDRGQHLRGERHLPADRRGVPGERHLGPVPAQHPRRDRQQREGRDPHARPQPAGADPEDRAEDAVQRLRDRVAHRADPVQGADPEPRLQPEPDLDPRHLRARPGRHAVLDLRRRRPVQAHRVARARRERGARRQPARRVPDGRRERHREARREDLPHRRVRRHRQGGLRPRRRPARRDPARGRAVHHPHLHHAGRQGLRQPVVLVGPRPHRVGRQGGLQARRPDARHRRGDSQRGPGDRRHAPGRLREGRARDQRHGARRDRHAARRTRRRRRRARSRRRRSTRRCRRSSTPRRGCASARSCRTCRRRRCSPSTSRT